jgi:hypothetical protein
LNEKQIKGSKLKAESSKSKEKRMNIESKAIRAHGENRACTGACPYETKRSGVNPAPTKDKWISRCTGINDPPFTRMLRYRFLIRSFLSFQSYQDIRESRLDKPCANQLKLAP